MRTKFSADKKQKRIFRHTRILQALFAIAVLASSFTSCKKDDIHPVNDTVTNQKEQACFKIDTDYPYYIVTYKHAGMDKAEKVQVKDQKHWELCFEAKKGDPFLLEVYTLTSNLPATQVKASIYFGGKLIKENVVMADCANGQCPTANRSVELKLEQEIPVQ